MPERKTLQRAARDKKQGKSPSTQAGEFVREEIDHVREGKHGVRSTKQAIAIGLSKARRAGVDLPSPKKASASTRRKAKQDSEAAHDGHAKSPTRALKRESARPASKSALSRHASKTASRRTAADRSAAAKKAAATKGAAGRSAAAKKAARTRAANRAAAHH